ncbi:ATP-binding protein [Streptomyces virginiae]|uniref:ATP-binding protein n=1 Tax=Streptomyces virginiae TaxID=1961 RepID=UPI0036EFC133
MREREEQPRISGHQRTSSSTSFAAQNHQVTVDTADVLLLAVAELVGNAVRHAGVGRVRVGVALGAGWLRLDVADRGPTCRGCRPPARRSTRSPRVAAGC